MYQVPSQANLLWHLSPVQVISTDTTPAHAAI